MVSVLEVAILVFCPNAHANHHPGLIAWPKTSGFQGEYGMYESASDLGIAGNKCPLKCIPFDSCTLKPWGSQFR